MVNSHRFYNCFNDNFKLLSWLLIFFIAITPNFIFISNANASAAEKWELLENTYDTAQRRVHLETRKITTDASNNSKYSVDVPVNAADLGKTVKGMLGMGLGIAAVTALVESVGWVIEEGSKIYKIEQPTEPTDPLVKFLYSPHYKPEFIHLTPKPAAEDEIANNCKTNAMYCSPNATVTSCGNPNQNLGPGQTASLTCIVHTSSPNNDWNRTIQYKANPNYDPFAEPNKIPVSDTELGTEILGEGKNTTPRPQIITDAYNPNNPASAEPAPAASNDALNNANPQPETQPQGNTTPKPNSDTDGDGVPDTVDPNAPPAGDNFELPAFCEWAPAVCDFFTVQKQDNTALKENQNKQLEQDKTFFEKVTDFFTWNKEEPLPDETTTVQVEEHSILFDDSSKVSFNNSCPAPELINIDFQGISQNIEFSYTPLCNFLNMIRPFVIASSYLIGAYIVMGLSRGSAD